MFWVSLRFRFSIAFLVNDYYYDYYYYNCEEQMVPFFNVALPVIQLKPSEQQNVELQEVFQETNIDLGTFGCFRTLFICPNTVSRTWLSTLG